MLWRLSRNFNFLASLLSRGDWFETRFVEDFDFVSTVPHSNHHTVGTASWQNHDSSHPQSVI